MKMQNDFHHLELDAGEATIIACDAKDLDLLRETHPHTICEAYKDNERLCMTYEFKDCIITETITKSGTTYARIIK